MNGLEAIGWSPFFASEFEALNAAGDLWPARVAEEHRGVYELFSPHGTLRAEAAGRLLYTAASPTDLPGVGDWVAISPRPAEGAATICAVLPRRSALIRNSPDGATRGQLLASNLDSVFVVTSANRDFNSRRIERTLAIVAASGAEPVVVLSKVDLQADVSALIAAAREAAANVPVVALSSLTGEGLDALSHHLGDGRTIALIGSSGVGKSTLLNRLLGRDVQQTRNIRGGDDRGRHATTHRQLFPLSQGGALIDTPGLREIGLWEDEGSVDGVFPEIEALVHQCRFANCGHSNEPGCAIREALEEGRLEPARLASLEKLQREAEHIRGRRDPKARREQREKMKRFTKAIRSRPTKRDGFDG